MVGIGQQIRSVADVTDVTGGSTTPFRCAVSGMRRRMRDLIQRCDRTGPIFERLASGRRGKPNGVFGCARGLSRAFNLKWFKPPKEMFRSANFRSVDPTRDDLPCWRLQRFFT
jgi:hypothetical protein